MSKEDFEAAIENAKKLEKSILEYSAYEGDIGIESTLDLEPAEYVDLTFSDLVNEYERAHKILSTRKLDIYAGEEKEAKPTAQSAEVETRLREMTTRTLEQAKEVGKEPALELERLEEAPAPEEKAPEIELERPEAPEIELERPAEKPGEPEIEIERPEARKEKPPEAPEIEIEKLEAPEIEIEKPPEEEPEAPGIEVPEAIEEKPAEAKAPPKTVPPALRESPSQAADRRYQQMEEQIRSTLGEKADELALKKKMLELTKQLFKEKSYNKRAEIKLQITVLKNMLVGVKEGKPAKKGKKDETYTNLYKTMVSTQQAEIANTKDKVIDAYNKRIDGIKGKFYEELASAEDAGKRKEIYEAFVFSVQQLVEKLPESIKEREDFIREKHTAELQKLKESIADKDKNTLADVEKRLDLIEKSYGKEFSSIKRIVGSSIDTLIEVTGDEIFKAPEEKPDKEVKVREIVKEINETDEGTLLYFLHSNDLDYYRKYERKQISKAEAIAKAKALMAKEKGLKSAAVKKYFSQEEE